MSGFLISKLYQGRVQTNATNQARQTVFTVPAGRKYLIKSIIANFAYPSSNPNFSLYLQPGGIQTDQQQIRIDSSFRLESNIVLEPGDVVQVVQSGTGTIIHDFLFFGANYTI